MARGVWSLGDATAVGITTVIPGSTGGWGGTANTLRYFSPYEGNATGHWGQSQEHDPATMDPDPLKVTTGGSVCNGSFRIPLSYSYDEGIMALIAGAVDVAAGAGAPYTHTITPARGPLYANIVYYWEKYTGARLQRLMTNALITKVSIVQELEKTPYIEVNWYAQKWTESTPGAAPTLVTLEYADWLHNVLTLGNETFVHKGFTLDIDWPADEGDYGIGSTDDPAPTFVGRGGQRITTLSVNGALDDDILGYLGSTAGTALSASNTIVWNNGLSTTAEREILITLTGLKVKDADVEMAKRGRLPVTLTMLACGAAPFLWVSQNALAVAEPPAV